MQRTCKDCGNPFWAYNGMQNRCQACTAKRRKPAKPRKAIAQRGKKTMEYEEWRDKVAKPYLDKKYGRICAACGGLRCGNRQLDVDHKQKRGSHAELKMDLNNVQYLGRFPCHYEKDNTV